MAEVVSSLEDHLGKKGGKLPWTMEEPDPIDVQPPRSKTPRRGRRDASTERNLAEVREAHQRALAMAATLEEEIEWLSHPITRGQLEAWAHSRSWDCHRWRSRGQKRRHYQVWLEDCHAPYCEYHPPWKGPESKGDKEAPMDFNLEAPLELGPEVKHFLQGPAKVQRRRIGRHPPQNLWWKSWRVWWLGEPGCMKHLAGGRN